MSKFSRQVRFGKIASPFRRDFNLLIWRLKYEETAASSSEEEALYHAGFEFDKRLSGLWKRFEDLDIARIDGARLRRGVVAMLNRGTRVLGSSFQEKLPEVTIDNTFFTEDAASYRMEIDQTGAQYNLDDMIGSLVDGALLVFRKSFDLNLGKGEKPSLPQLKEFTMLGQFHTLLLSLWEDCVWRGYRCNHDGAKISVTPFHIEEAKNSAVALARYYARVTEVLMHCVGIWKNASLDFRARLSGQTLKVDLLGSGRTMRLIPKYSNDLFSPSPPRSKLLRICGTEVYFDSIVNIPLPKCGNITVNQLLSIWEVVFSLAKTLERNLPEETGLDSINELDKFAPLIPKGALIELLKKCSGLSHSKCNEIIKFLTFSKSQKEEIWARPFVECDSLFLAPVLGCILYSNPLRMIEQWMKLGGLDLAARGSEYELHCRKEVGMAIKENRLLENSGALPHAYKFKSGKDDPGDIDIVIWIGNRIVIGEIKCNLFPAKASEKARHLEEMRSAVSQITKKHLKFAERVESIFRDLTGYNTDGAIEIIPIVLTNVTLGVGLTIDGVPVVDLLILKKYFQDGCLDKFVVMDHQGNPESGYRLRFYDNPKEAEERLRNYLLDPPQLWHFQDSLTPIENPIVSLVNQDEEWTSVEYVVNVNTEDLRRRDTQAESNGRFPYGREVF
jgi:hypothetical protein